MESLAKQYLISFYENRLRLLGDRPETLGWTPAGQQRQYGLVLQIAEDLTGKRILDYGCGKGDLCRHMEGLGININYTGFDINPALIELARKNHPERLFRVFDIEERGLSEAFDYVFLCGVFNTKVEGVAETIKNVIKRLFVHAKEGLAFTALSSSAPEKDFALNYTSPEEMLEFAHKHITPNVGLMHSSDHFIIFLYRR